jgi:hypothetical protein
MALANRKGPRQPRPQPPRLLLPRSVAPRAQPGYDNASVYLSYRELSGGETMSEQEIVAVLKSLSAADCLSSLAHISTRLFAATGPSGTREALQLQLVSEVLGDGPPGQQMQHRLRIDPRRVAFFEQQLVHLARLVILHADRRPPDDFKAGASYADWVRACLFGVTDLLDALLDPEDPDARLAWEIRQSVFNHHEDTAPVVGIHHEIYRVLWDEPHDPRAVEASAAFERSTGMSIADYFTVGSTVLARLVNRGDHEDGLAAISPAPTSRRPASLPTPGGRSSGLGVRLHHPG